MTKKDIYSFPHLYDAAHYWKTNDHEFIVKWAEMAGNPILELAAGTGRLALPLLEKGLTYTGLEMSPQYAQVARKKLENFDGRAHIIEGDMRTFNLKKQFNFIFIGFNSFLHLLTNKDAEKCLDCVYQHLGEKGYFLIDIFIPEPSFLNRKPDTFYDVMEFPHPEGGQCQVKEKTQYDSVSEINHVDWYFYRKNLQEPDHFSFDMRMYYPDTMDRLLTEAGFSIVHKFGEYDESLPNEESPLQVYVCQRK